MLLRPRSGVKGAGRVVTIPSQLCQAFKAMEALLNPGNRYELVIEWKLGKSQPVTITFLAVNDEVLLRRQPGRDSPIVLRGLPPPKAGAFVVTWSITPEVFLHGVAINIVNISTGKQVKVDSVKDVERGSTWRKEVTVDAP